MVMVGVTVMVIVVVIVVVTPQAQITEEKAAVTKRVEVSLSWRPHALYLCSLSIYTSGHAISLASR